MIKKEYYFSRTAIILTSILLIVIMSIFVFAMYLFFDAGLHVVLAVCLLIFFLFLTTLPAFFRRIRFYKAKKPALVLTKDLLIDNINLQTIKWTDIKNVSATSVKINAARINNISISLVDPNEYIDKISNPYKRLIARLNEKYFGGAFSIQPNIIKCKSPELLSSLKLYFNEASILTE